MASFSLPCVSKLKLTNWDSAASDSTKSFVQVLEKINAEDCGG